MRKNYLKIISSFLLTTLLMIGCQKDFKEAKPAAEPASNPEENLQVENEKSKNECRLTNFTYPFGEYNYQYNSQGLCDEWDIADYGIFRQEYDAYGKMAKSRWYIGNDLVATIHFFYEGKKVVKEIWYNGNTSEIGDEIFYTYNNKGKMVRMESFMNDYYTVATFSPQGNTVYYIFYYGGEPYYEAYQTHNRPIKNPYLAVHGIEHGFPFVNPSYNSDKWWASSEKLIFYDENGDPVVLFDYDPSQTTWQLGHQNYPLSATYYDLVSETWSPYTFEYENCAPGNVTGNPRTSRPASAVASRMINPGMLMKYNPSKSIKERVREIRRQLKSK